MMKEVVSTKTKPKPGRIVGSIKVYPPTFEKCGFG